MTKSNSLMLLKIVWLEKNHHKRLLKIIFETNPKYLSFVTNEPTTLKNIRIIGCKTKERSIFNVIGDY